MKVFVTSMLNIDLDSERWECASCGHDIGDARDNYKKGLLVRERDPSEIHAPILDAAPTESAVDLYRQSVGSLV